MSDVDTQGLVDEILQRVDQVGEVENWFDQRLDGSIDSECLEAVFVQVTERLLGAEPPNTGQWEHVFVTLAGFSRSCGDQAGLKACRAVLSEIRDLVDNDRFSQVDPRKITTIASAMTVSLAAQNKLRQPIEELVKLLCERFPDLVGDMGQQCQDIWKRRGQMSGWQGLFVWDTRHQHWRLTQDFKPHRSME